MVPITFNYKDNKQLWEISLLGRNTVYLSVRFQADVLLRLFFDPENGGDMFPQNVGWFLTAHTALYPRRQNSLCPPLWVPQIVINEQFVTTDAHGVCEYEVSPSWMWRSVIWQIFTDFSEKR
jgi:hypothetical protein